MSQRSPSKDPFGATKANDLDDSQIQDLWVDVLGIDDEIGGFAHPNGYIPTFILGGKGSGKTHLMRYHSFELQCLRFRAAGMENFRDGVAEDGYIGIYALFGSINSGRFAGKGQSSERWGALFAYYLELWLAHHLLSIIDQLQLSTSEETTIVRGAFELFDKLPAGCALDSIAELLKFLADLQRELDYEVTNAVMTGRVNVELLVTRGKLLFGLPKLLSKTVPCLHRVLFMYCIDQFEDLTEDQQQIVNSFVRDKQAPSTLRVGSRLYGVKTHRTEGGAEENLRESEYRQLVLDSVFRQHKERYASFAKALVKRRLEAALERSVAIDSFFEDVDDSWGSAYVQALAPGTSEDRVHFKNLITRLATRPEVAGRLVAALRCERSPLLEKLNILLFYQRVSRKKNWFDSAQEVSDECRAFLSDVSQRSRYKDALQHYKSDLLAQLNRENNRKQQLYLGLDTFIAMSAGLPRALLTILRSIFEWSMFQGEDPLRNGKVSVEAQYRGVRDATAWFFNHMRKAGDEGASIQHAVARLGQLFRINRFGDRPIEVSLCAFSLDPSIGSVEARQVLRLSEERSFLVSVPDGGRDKNSGDPLLKYQISPMLAPRWDLPIARRGTVTLTEREFDAIFRPDGLGFDAIVADWTARISVPLGTGPDGGGQPELI